MKKGMGLKLGAIILALSLFGCSSDLMEETKKNLLILIQLMVV